MKIHNLQVANFKILRGVGLSFNPRLNLFVGVNGAGKTSVLEALSICLRAAVEMFRSPSLSMPIRLIDDRQITNDRAEASIGISCVGAFSDYMTQWRVAQTRKGEPKQRTSELIELKHVIKLFRGTERANDERAGVFYSLPVMAYYGTNRAVLETPMRPRSHSFTQIDAYEDAFEGAVNFKDFFLWFREREDIENEQRQDDRYYEDRELNAVRKAMSTFLPDCTNWRVRRQPLRFEVRKGEQYVRVDDLSDGEKCVLALFGDLARRLAMANPNMSDPSEGEGVALIDEIELHLHPSWQYEILPSLLRTFPNLQFFVTTHSAPVVSSIPTESIYTVHSGEIFQLRQSIKTQGKDVNSLLAELFGASFAAASQERDDLNRYAAMLDEGNALSDEGESLYQRLLSYFGTTDPVMEALTFRRELLQSEGAQNA